MVSRRGRGVSILVLAAVLVTAGLTRVAGVSLTIVEPEAPVSFPVCPNPLIIKITVKRKQNIDFTRDDYGAKIYG